jgi:hypothetical protein
VNRFNLYFNAAFVAVWTAMLPITLLTGLKGSVPYVAAISVWALIVGHFGATISSHIAVQQETTHAKLDRIHRHVRSAK